MYLQMIKLLKEKNGSRCVTCVAHNQGTANVNMLTTHMCSFGHLKSYAQRLMYFLFLKENVNNIFITYVSQFFV